MKWAFDLTEIFALGTMKLSVIFFYRRVFRGQTFDFYSKSMIALVGVWITAFFLATLFECGTRFQYMWTDILDVSTQCTNSVMYHNAYAISDLITEVLILAMPIPIVRIRQTETAVDVANGIQDLAITDVSQPKTGCEHCLCTGLRVSSSVSVL